MAEEEQSSIVTMTTEVLHVVCFPGLELSEPVIVWMTEVKDHKHSTPINQQAPSLSSSRLSLSLPFSLAFCSWPGGSLQHLEVDGEPDSSASGFEH